MRITLISPQVLYIPTPPLGICYLGAVLKEKGHEVQLIDDRPSDNQSAEGPASHGASPGAIPSEAKFFGAIRKFGPEILGVSMTTTQVPMGRKIIKWAQENLPNTFIIAGGVHATALPEETLKGMGIDAVAYGEGENTIIELCERLEKGKGEREQGSKGLPGTGKGLEGIRGLVYKDGDKIRKNPPMPLIEDLDSLPFPARELLDFEWYMQPPGMIRGYFLKRSASMITGRGCPYGCIYCSSKLIFGQRTRLRSVDNVMAEIDQLYEKYRIDGLFFHDDTFTVNHDWVYEFCKKLSERNYGIRWGCQGRVNTVNEKLLRTMKDAGCRQIAYGVESGSPKILKVLNKGTTPEMVKAAFKTTKKAGVRGGATFMLGNPYETIDDIKQTLELAEAISASYTKFFYTTPYPKTKLYEMAVENGWIDKNLGFSELWSTRHSEEPVMEVNFKKAELKKIRAQLQNKFFFKNYYVYMKSPLYLFQLGLFALKQPSGLISGAKSMVRTKRLDDLWENVLGEYRKKTKEAIQGARNQEK